MSGTMEEITSVLEATKFKLVQQMGKERKAKKELETKITALESRVQERRVRLGEYNALFMSIEKAEERAAVERGAAPSKDKAARQKLGAREAISGTKRIIDINLNKMENEIATQGMKLNKSRDHNLKLKDKIDALRKEHLTYNKLFATLGHDLEMYKEKIKTVRKAIKESYDARDHAQEDMANLLKQFENDKMERNKEWQLYTSAIEEADKEGLASNMPLGIQGMTKEEEAEIKKKIRHGQMTMAKEKNMLLLAKAKITAYNEALAYIRQQTGYEDLQDVVDLFNKYEEEKYEKLGAISRLLVEIERNESELEASRTDVASKESTEVVIKASHAKHVALLESQALSAEDKARETMASTARVVGEVKSLSGIVEMLFFSLNAGGSLAVPPSQLSLTSPLKTTTTSAASRASASMKMYSSPALVQSVQEPTGGVPMSSLANLMGMVENKAADIIQTYAAKLTMGGVSLTGDALEAEDTEEAEALEEEKALAAAGEEGGDIDAEKVSEKIMERVAAEKAAETTRPFISPASLGPSKPTGKLKESLTMSALVSAMTISASALGGEGGGGGGGGGGGSRGARGGAFGGGAAAAVEEEEEEGKNSVVLRPLPIEELKRQAYKDVRADKTVKAIGQAAAMAAYVLGNK